MENKNKGKNKSYTVHFSNKEQESSYSISIIVPIIINNNDMKFGQCNFYPNSIKFSPVHPLKVLIAGNGRVYDEGKFSILDFSAPNPIGETCHAQHHICDSAWSKLNPNDIIIALGNGSFNIINLALPSSSWPSESFNGHSYSIESVDYNPFLPSFVTASSDHTAKDWLVDDFRLLYTHDSHTGVVNCARWNPCNPFVLATVSADRTVGIWDHRTNLVMLNPGDNESITSCDWDWRGNVIATTTYLRNYIRVWDIRKRVNPVEVISSDLGDWLNKVKFSPHRDGEIAACSSKGKVIVWDHAQGHGKYVKEIYQHNVTHVSGMDMSMQVDGWMASTNLDGHVYLWKHKMPGATNSAIQ